MDSTASKEIQVDYEVMPETERTLVLLGRTGNGKSATGNSILGKNKFKSKARGTFITQKCELQRSKLPNGQTINVIDTPGLFSASSTTDFTIREIFKCLQLAKNGIDAVLLVFSLRNRLTEEEQSTLRTLKILFGSEIVNYIIVVFTNEDALEDGDSLDDYLQDCPEFQEILKECDDRKVLFDNSRYAPESKRRKQVQDVFSLVEQISRNNKGVSFMSDLSHEIRESEAIVEERNKEINAMRGFYSKQEIAQMKKDAARSNTEMFEGMKEKIANQLKESMKDVNEQLVKAQAAREETEKRLSEIHQLSSDEIRRLREQLNNAEKETARLRKELGNKKCTIL